MIILISLGIALGGCATTGPGGETKSTIPQMEYQDIDVWKNGNITKVPAYMDAKSAKWYFELNKVKGNIKAGIFTNKYDVHERITLVCDVKKKQVLLLVYDNGTTFDFYIYDGKQYPTKTTEQSAKAYMKLITSKEGV